MSQKRIQDFGSPVTASSLKLMNKSYVTSAILSGNEFLADGADRLRVNPGVSVTNQGVLIIEDEPKFLQITNTSNPVDYTVYYLHVDADISGGVPAELTLQTGLLISDVVTGVILGYVRYPGGGVPLNNSFFIQPEVVRIGRVIPTRTNADWIIPIRNQGYMITAASGGSLTITDVYDTSGISPQMYVRIRNNTLTTGAITMIFPFKVKDAPYAKLQMILGTDINATLNPSFIDSNGNTTVLTVAPFTGHPTLAFETLDLPNASIQTPNTLVYLRLEIQASANRQVILQALGLTEFNLPI